MQFAVRPLADAYALAGAGRLNEAVPIIQAHAEGGNAEALFTLGDLYWRGIGVERDHPRALELFRRSSDGGFPMAVRAYTNLLANGAPGTRDWQGALARLSAEARADQLRAWMFSLISSMNLTQSGGPVSVAAGEKISDRPHAMIFRQGFTGEECDFLRTVAEPTYEESKVIGTEGDVRTLLRTSDGSTLHWLVEDPATHALNRRLAAFAGTDVNQGEPLHFLRYRPGQEYRPHVDWLLDDNPRVLTGLVYLNEDYGGGETAFVRTGLKVTGRKGDVLVFRSQGPDGGLDPLSEHAGLPVTSGVKYLASRWIRARKHVGKLRLA